MEKAEQTFTRFLEDDKQLDYPDFDAMWSRIEKNIPAAGTKLAPVDMSAPRRKRLRKLTLIASLTAVLAASPVIAAISYNWEHILSFRSGVQSALEQGLGQNIGKSVTIDGVTMTIHTAIVDDNRTVLLYSLSAEGGTPESLYFSAMELKDADGRTIEGRHSQFWDKDSKTFSGYFETEWTPDGLEADVQLTASTLQSFSSAERDIALDPSQDKLQTFDIRQDGIGRLTVRPFVQGEKMLLDTAVEFERQDAMKWTFPRIGVYKDGALVKEAGPGAFGKPGEHGEYTGKQYYQLGDLQGSSATFKLLYTREERRIDKDWAFALHLDKKQMLSGTVKHGMNVPVEFPAGRMTLEEMIVTPTQIRIIASHEKYMRIPYLRFALDVNGTLLDGGTWPNEDPEKTTFRFELPPGVKVTEQTPVSFAAKYEVLEHKDATEPIKLTDIGERKMTLTTKVGGYSVLWTYYKQDGKLYVQSECADPSFGGINQTYIMKDGNRLIGKPVTTNFMGDGNNRAIDEYPDFTGTEAELHIFWYYTETPDKELRVPLYGQDK
ncbi:DUF4179 domain-containing protein [Paenibacillus hamazuiensis]|uniref:DUF4179 domain-containing protein n=1 Tax=Paenibacillus hamazuiensis TaxID=2936508 RepID=UPI00200BCC8F|nr:DUF4179 domain-containing protein [Paenibacillus hamazuiensis]